jgi:hypothetical protein
MDSLKAELHTFIDDPMDPTNNYNMGIEYYEKKQYAAAFSHFMRASERSDDTRFATRSLLYASKSMGSQGGRDAKELDLIAHALSIGYKYPEVHCIKAMYHSWRKDWTQCYATCCMALELTDTYEVDEPFLDYSGKESILNQKAMAEYHRARYNDSRATYNSILDMDISDWLRRQIQSKMKEFPEPYSEPITWDYNHSQIFQDVFVETVMDKKENGTYLEIGAGNYKFGNNTLMLEEKYGWKGVSLEWNKDLVYKFNTNRKNQCICADATKVDYTEILKDLPNTIDYLQLDCDPPSVTFEILKLIPFDTHQFNVITYEHDYYNDPTKSFRQKSRDYLTSKGYILAVGDVTADREEQMNFEDWWVHPSMVSNCPRIHTQGPICGERYFEPNRVSTNIITFGDDLFKNQKVRFKKQAEALNWFDNITIETPDTISEFVEEHSEFFDNNPRGYGYWTWKPYIIERRLSQLKMGDILVYLDCGSSILNQNKEKLDKYVDLLGDKDVIVFDAGDQKFNHFVKMNVVKEFDLLNKPQTLNSTVIEGGCVIIKKTQESVDFIKSWKHYLTVDNYKFVNDELYGEDQLDSFKSSRHDQIILGVLARDHKRVHICQGIPELYSNGPLFHSRLTDAGPREFAKPVPSSCVTLEILGSKYGTDKVDGTHTYKDSNYCNIYDKHFNSIRNTVTKFVEIGIKDGCSLRMWKEYFPNATIYGVDIDPSCKQYEEDRIKCIIGDQNNEEFLMELKDTIGEYDILLDDGSHITKHQIKSFDILYENCKTNGFYIIEDLRCSYENYLNHHDIRTHWPGMKYNDPNDTLKNYRQDFNNFIQDKVQKLDFHNSGKMFNIHFYPMIVIFENR